MRYLRTEAGAVLSYDETLPKAELPTILDYPSQIVKDSEHITDLIDEYIVVYPNQKPFLTSLFSTMQGTEREKIEALANYYEGAAVFGAIWVIHQGYRAGVPTLEPIAAIQKLIEKTF